MGSWKQSTTVGADALVEESKEEEEYHSFRMKRRFRERIVVEKEEIKKCLVVEQENEFLQQDRGSERMGKNLETHGIHGEEENRKNLVRVEEEMAKLDRKRTNLVMQEKMEEEMLLVSKLHRNGRILVMQQKIEEEML